jgi:ABC-type transporter Mla subunit MlaD
MSDYSVTDLGRMTVNQADSRREPIAKTLNKTAATLHDQAETVAGLAHAAANKLEATANFLRENDLESVIDSVKKLAKRHPVQCLAAVTIVGFVVAHLVRKSN